MKSLFLRIVLWAILGAALGALWALFHYGTESWNGPILTLAVSFGLAGVDPYRMLHGNPQACEKALRRAGLSFDDMAVIEVNEAFASVVL